MNRFRLQPELSGNGKRCVTGGDGVGDDGGPHRVARDGVEFGEAGEESRDETSEVISFQSARRTVGSASTRPANPARNESSSAPEKPQG